MQLLTQELSLSKHRPACVKKINAGLCSSLYLCTNVNRSSWIWCLFKNYSYDGGHRDRTARWTTDCVQMGPITTLTPSLCLSFLFDPVHFFLWVLVWQFSSRTSRDEDSGLFISNFVSKKRLIWSYNLLFKLVLTLIWIWDFFTGTQMQWVFSLLKSRWRLLSNQTRFTPQVQDQIIMIRTVHSVRRSLSLSVRGKAIQGHHKRKVVTTTMVTLRWRQQHSLLLRGLRIVI